MLHETARFDNVELSCEARRMVFNKTMLIPEARLPASWRDEYLANINRIVCSNRVLRRMALTGWQFSENVTFPDGSRVTQTASCEGWREPPPLTVVPMPARP